MQDSCDTRLSYYFLTSVFHPAVRVQVLETLKDPLQTLIQGREPEVVWAVLSNFLVLAQRYPLIFSQVRRPSSAFFHSCFLLAISLTGWV